MNVFTNDESFLSSKNNFFLKVSNCRIRPCGAWKMFRFDVEITPYGVDIIKNEKGFFETLTKGISIRMFSPYYQTEDAYYQEDGNRIHVYMERKNTYSSYEEIKSIFDNSINIHCPSVSLEKYPVSETIRQKDNLMMTVVSDENRKYVVVVPGTSSDISRYLTSSFYNSKREFYAKLHSFTVSTSKDKLETFLEEFFEDGYVCYKDKKSGHFVFVENEACEFCDDVTVSSDTLYDRIELCPECYKHRSIIKKIISDLPDECEKNNKGKDKNEKRTEAVQKTASVVKIRRKKS